MSGDTVIGNSLQFTNDNKYAYAYSGDIPASVSTTTPLTFVTASEYIIANITWNGHVDNNNIGVGVIGTVEIEFNGVVVATLVCDTGAEDQPTQCFLKIIIPPFTSVKMNCSSNNNDVNSMASIVVSGKVGMAQRVGNLE
jgi:hypothetical protein